MITVFTPTYNRAYRLPKLYQSLLRQTNKDFEWIVVDDGSTDNTEELISNWIIETLDFKIKYIKKKNGGKHTAINLGVESAFSEWFYIVDSDDYVTDDAIEMINKWINSGIDERYAAVSGLKMFNGNEIIGGKVQFSGKFVDCKNNERKKYGLEGDKAEVYRTSVLKKYPFKIFENEKFLSEGAVWDKIAHDGYLIRWFNYPIMICEYLDDGLTAEINGNDLEIKNFNGYTYWTNVRITTYSGLEKIRIICQYINKAKIKGLNTYEISFRLGLDKVTISLLSVLVDLKKALLNKR